MLKYILTKENLTIVFDEHQFLIGSDVPYFDDLVKAIQTEDYYLVLNLLTPILPDPVVTENKLELLIRVLNALK